MKRNERGFTLIEMLVAVALVGILAAIAYPSYRNQIMRSNRTEARNALLKAQVEQEKFYMRTSPSRYAGNATSSPTELNALPTDTPTFGLGIPSTTPNGYYTILLTTPASGQSYLVTATATGSQAKDTNCAKFFIDEKGNQTSKNSSNALSTGCWK